MKMRNNSKTKNVEIYIYKICNINNEHQAEIITQNSQDITLFIS